MASLAGGRRCALIAARQFRTPERDGLAARGQPAGGHHRALIHGVIHRAAEIPDGNNRAPLLGRQHEK